MDSPTPSSSGLAKTLIQVAYYHVGAIAERSRQLKRIASKLPPIPFDLTAKNKALLRQFESDGLRAKLLFLPGATHGGGHQDAGDGPVRLRQGPGGDCHRFPTGNPAQAAKSELASIGRRHFSEPDGPKGRLLLHIPAAETKSRREDFIAEVPEHVAQRLRWYRRHILPRLNADLNGDLFVTKKGKRKNQKNHHQSDHQGHRALSRHPHDAAPVPALRGTSYLDENPRTSRRPERCSVTPGARPLGSMSVRRAGVPAAPTTISFSRSARR